MIKAQEIVDLLNSAVARDPVAIHALLINRVPCNQALVQHPTIVADSLRRGNFDRYVVGLGGILNGLVWETGSLVAAMFDEADGSLVGFCVVKRQDVEVCANDE